MNSEREPTLYKKGSKIVAMILAATAFGGCGENTDVVGGCDTFGVVAQGRWDPLGAAVRAEPDVLAPRIEPGIEPNEVIAVDGWVETEPAYPDNPPPWNSDVWYHLANRDGWVSFAAVRGASATYDKSGLEEYGGEPAPTPAECRDLYRP